ncbi:hypothetical protein BX667DRAFT_502541 [Coemansia mojavensis]|nr:hypothetical protein BX667DRAFT_502541 [Coemansia mojavensis]
MLPFNRSIVLLAFALLGIQGVIASSSPCDSYNLAIGQSVCVVNMDGKNPGNQYIRCTEDGPKTRKCARGTTCENITTGDGATNAICK